MPSLSSVGGPVNPSTGVSSAPGSGGMKLDFTFDPELARIAELKDRSGGNVTPPAADMSNEASADLNMKVSFEVTTIFANPTLYLYMRNDGGKPR